MSLHEIDRDGIDGDGIELARRRYGLQRTDDQLLLLAKGGELYEATGGDPTAVDADLDWSAEDSNELIRLEGEEGMLAATLADFHRRLMDVLDTTGHQTLGEAGVTEEWLLGVLDDAALSHGLIPAKGEEQSE